MSEAKQPINLSKATPDELRALCKKQAGQVKLLFEKGKAAKTEVDALKQKDEEKSTKIAALNECVENLTKENEKKLEEWKEIAKQRISKLQLELSEVKQKNGSSPSPSSPSETEKKKDAWIAAARQKITQLESKLTDNDNNQEQMDTFQNTLSDRETKINSLEKELSNSKNIINDLREALSTAENAAKEQSEDLSKKSNDATIEINELRKTLSEKDAAIEKEISNSNKKIEELQRSVSDGDDGIQKLLLERDHKIESLQKVNIEKIEAVNQLHKSLSQRESELSRSEEVISNLKSDSESKTEEIVDLTQTITNQCAQIENLQESAAAFAAEGEEEVAKLQGCMEKHNQILQDLKTAADAEVSNLSHALQQSEQEQSLLKNQLCSKDDLIAELKEATNSGANSAEIEVSNLNKTLQQRTDELRSESSALSESKELVLNLKRELDQQQQQLEEQQLSISSLKESEAVASKQSKESDTKEIKQLQESLRESENKIRTLTAKVEDLSFFEEMQGNASNNADLEQKLQEITLKASHLESLLELSQNDLNTTRDNVKKQETANISLKKELVSSIELIDTLKKQVQSVTDVSQKKFEKFKILAKDQHSASQEQIESLSSEMERIKEKATTEIRNRTLELKESTADFDKQKQSLNEIIIDKDNQLEDTLLRVERLTDQISSSEQQYILRLEEERREIENSLQDRIETVTVEYSLKLEESTNAAAKYLEEAQGQLQQSRKEMKSIRESLIKEKEKQAALSQLEINRLQEKLCELERGDVTGRKVLSPPLNVNPSPNYSDPTPAAQRDLGPSMMLLAQQQANRDGELQSLTVEVSRLTELTKSLTIQRDDIRSELQSLNTTQSERISSDNRKNLNMDYLKNILVKFLSEGNKTVQAGLVPVIATMLELTNAEKTGIRKVFPNAKV